MKKYCNTVVKNIIYRYIISMLYIVCIIGTLYAVEPEKNTTSRIRVGFFPISGYLEKDNRGEFSGFGHEYLLKIAEYTNWNYEYVAGTWEECLEMLKNGEIDLLGSMQRTLDREQAYDYVDYQTGINFGALYIRSDNPVAYEDFDVFGTYTIGLIKGYAQNKTFFDYCKKNNFTPEFKEYYTTSELLEALRTKKVDAIVDNTNRKTVDERMVAKFDPSPFWFATTKGNTELLDTLNKAIIQLKLDNPYYEIKLQDKYYRTASHTIVFTRAEQDFINNTTIRIAGNPNWYPIEYKDQSTKKLLGITVDIFDTIAQKAHLDIEQYQTHTGLESIEALQNGKADILMSVSYNPRFINQYSVKLSIPYFHINTEILARKDITKKQQYILALPEPRSEIVSFIQENHSEFIIKLFPSQKDCIAAVRAGEADCIIDITYRSDEFLRNSNNRDFILLMSTDYSYDICFAVAKDSDPRLLQIINKTILSLSQNQINEVVFAHTINKRQTIYVKDFISQYFTYLVSGLFVIILILIFLWYQYTRRVYTLAYIDSLTKLPNKERFCLNIATTLKLAKKNKYALIILDIDKFKWINDFFGFETGNIMLKHISECLTKNLCADEQCARIGGDEFALLLDYKNKQELISRLKNIVDSIKSIDNDALVNYKLHIFFGIYENPNPKENPQILLDRAFLALIASKDNIEEYFSFYDNELRSKIAYKKELENKMEISLLEGQFVPYFQGKYCIETSHIIGAEALVRWITPNGIILPKDFISIFEENGFIRELDIYMFNSVCILLNRWIKKGISPLPISVNMSRLHLYQSDFTETLVRITEKYQIPPSLIEIELTESAAFEDMAILMHLMHKLKGEGFTLAMDDFGTGYSSLNLLKDVPFDVLKLDKEFFSNCEEEERSEVVMENVIRMAKGLNTKTVSEGVETEKQMQFLKKVGCDIAQGYYFAKPIPADDFEQTLEKEQRLNELAANAQSSL